MNMRIACLSSVLFFSCLTCVTSVAEGVSKPNNSVRCAELQAAAKKHQAELQKRKREIIEMRTLAYAFAEKFGKEDPADQEKFGGMYLVVLVTGKIQSDCEKHMAVSLEISRISSEALKSKNIPDATLASLEKMNEEVEKELHGLSNFMKNMRPIMEDPEKAIRDAKK